MVRSARVAEWCSVAVKHTFVSSVADGADTTLVRPSNWNADHTIDNSTITNAMLAGSIAASKLVGTDIATVGTITSGTWNGTDIAVADGGTGAGTASGARDNLGLGTGDSPQFTAVNIGHASDTTLARAAAGIPTFEARGTALILTKTAVQVTAPADTNENIIFTGVIPANTLGANGFAILDYAVVWGSTNAKTWNVRIGGISGTIVSTFATTGSGANGGKMHIVIGNRNATNSQITFTIGAFGATSYVTAPVASAIDSTASIDVVVTVTKATGADVATFESGILTLYSDAT